MYEDAREAVLGLWKIRGVQNSATMNNIINTTYNNGGMLYYIISIIIIFVFLTLSDDEWLERSNTLHSSYPFFFKLQIKIEFVRLKIDRAT